MKKKLRLGMVGGGKDAFIGSVHRIASRIDDKFEFVAGCLSSTPEKSQASGKELGLDSSRIYSSFKEMAEKESRMQDGIDVVSIVTPNHMHAKPSIEFLKKNIHVICDKPMTASINEAKQLYNEVKKSSSYFFLTHNYSGYPVIREIRQLILNGEIGKIRKVKGHYLQGWLGQKEEDKGINKQAEWRTDPQRSGIAGSVGDIGSHLMHIIEFVSGLKLKEIAAELTTFVSGRKLDDDANILLRMSENVKGSLSVSQIATGEENNLAFSIYGEKGAIHWSQENPNYARLSKIDKRDRIITRGTFSETNSMSYIRVPPGHPEGYLEGFAQIYSDIADIINNSDNSNNLLKIIPDEEVGIHIMNFISACVESSKNNSKWIKL